MGIERFSNIYSLHNTKLIMLLVALTLRVEIPRHECGQPEGESEQVHGALLGVVVAKLNPACTIEDWSIEATLATTEQTNTVLVCCILSGSETILVFRTLALTVDPRLSL